MLVQIADNFQVSYDAVSRIATSYRQATVRDRPYQSGRRSHQETIARHAHHAPDEWPAHPSCQDNKSHEACVHVGRYRFSNASTIAPMDACMIYGRSITVELLECTPSTRHVTVSSSPYSKLLALGSPIVFSL
jgi:hypothetical protein